jgi:galactokinase
MIAEIKPNGTRIVRAYSIDLKDYAEFSLDDPKGPKAMHFRYIFGVCQEMMKLGIPVQGFNTAFAGDVPLGAGMSSSAALESCFAYALDDLFGKGDTDRMTLAKVGQATEHNYIGVNCGIMDQFASCHGKANNLMRLDCRSGEFQYFPWDPKGYKLVLVNSCVKHALVGSPYNDRRNSCERVAKAIGVETLRDADWDKLEAVKDQISEEDYKRAKYVIGEYYRVLAVCDALEKGDYETVGQKMYETHEGLSKDYEVSCEELDFLNEVAKECGVTGSRIMGGGFGGCTINLVAEELYKNFTETAKKRFKEKYGKEPVIIDVVIGDGARKLC